MRSSSSAPLAVVAEGWRRVAAFPAGVLGLLIVTALATAPAALGVRDAIEGHLGNSVTAERVAAGVDSSWWHEFESSAGPGRSFSPLMIGGAAPVSTYSDLLDGYGPPVEVVAPVMLGLLAWLFLSGGLLDRYARQRRVGTRVFFGTCAVFFFRFLRLAAITAVAYAVLIGPVHSWLFDGLYLWLTREVTLERTAFFLRVLVYLVWLAPLLLINLVADYAKVRAVVEDRHSMVGAMVAGARFLVRHPMSVLAVYAANALIAGAILLVYVLVAPDGRGGDWRLMAVLVVGGAYLGARLATRLAFLASATALFERALAHAEYTAPPLPVWPDSPAAEAIENLTSG